MGISRFMRNGKQRPTLWVENERATSGTRLRLTVNQMMHGFICTQIIMPAYNAIDDQFMVTF